MPVDMNCRKLNAADRYLPNKPINSWRKWRDVI